MRRLRRGIGRTTASILKFSADLTSTDKILSPSRGIGTATFSGGGQWIQDFEGKWRFVDANWPAVPGSRVVRNLVLQSEDMSQAVWSKIGGTTTPNSSTIVFAAAGIAGRVQQGVTLVGDRLNRTFRFSVTIPPVSGFSDPTAKITVNWGNVGTYVSPHPTLPTRISTITTYGSAGAIVYPDIHTDKVCTVAGIGSCLLEEVTGQTNQNPGEYVKTTSSPATKCYDYLNPYSVDGNGVVSDSGVRTVISGIKGYLSEPASTNKCTNYNTLTESLSAELITNIADRDFSSITGNYVLGTGTTISGGSINFIGNGSAGNSYLNGPTFISGRVYQFIYTIKNYVSGQFYLQCKGARASGNPQRSADGTYTETIIAGASGAGLYLNGSLNFNGSVDDISVKEVINGLGTVATSSSPTAIQGATLSGDAAATATVVDDSAALATAGLSQLVASGRVIKVDNSAGVGNAFLIFSGTTGNTNLHTVSIIARRTANGNIFLDQASSATHPVAATTAYASFSYGFTPSATNATVNTGVPAGSVAYVTLNQLEELPYATTPIVVNGATATRAATSLSYSGANLRGNNVAVTMEVTYANTPTASDSRKELLTCQSAGTGRFELRANELASPYVALAYGTGATVPTITDTSVTPVAGTIYKVGVALGSAGGKLFRSGALRTSDPSNAALSLSANIFVGSDNINNLQFNGQIRNLRIYWQDPSDGAMIARTT